MIAIAGAKGGCGKTTTTLEIAKALDRAGAQTLIVDADRQLPNLHAAAGVEREPTIAAFDREADISEIAQPLDDSNRTGVLPAPTDEQTVNLEQTLERLNQLPLEILVDCPAGAGPDVVDPISAADEVLVVTTETKQSQCATRKTIDIANRLGTPVLGGVLNKSGTDSSSFESRFSIPLLATVPEKSSLSENEEARRAFGRIASILLTESSPTVQQSSQTDSTRLSTGINTLDNALEGGFPAGSVVATTAAPGSQSELLLHALTRTRGTLYLSTEQSENIVLESIESSPVETGKPTVRYLSGNSALEDARQLVKRLPNGANVIIDTMDDLEQNDQESYRMFMNDLIDAVRSTSSIAMLHTLDRSPKPRNRSTTEHFADIVLRLESTMTDGDVIHELSIPKSRKNGITTSSVSLDLTRALTHKQKLTSSRA